MKFQAILVRYMLCFSALMILMLIYFLFDRDNAKSSIAVNNDLEIYASNTGVDLESGLVIDAGYNIVKLQCSGCHSLKLVAQNRFNREGWKNLIGWMQREQKLWDLGAQESVILDYLEKHQAPIKEGRRMNLKDIDWYVLNQ